MSFICPKCGAKEGEKKFIDAFCIDCYRFNIKIPLKGEIKFKLCPRCDRIYFSGFWQKYDTGKIKNYILSKCKGDFEDTDYDVDGQNAIFRIKRNGEVFEIKKKLSFEIDKNLCVDCNRMSGGYFEGIIQIRGENPDKVNKYADKMVKLLSKKTFVSKVEEQKEGIDLYIGSSKAVMGLLKEGGIKPLITRKLAGRREGKKIYRTTFLLRM